MPNETLITEIENALSEVVRLGGENERSQIVPNLTVQDANPAQTGFIVVSDDRDGDNILAKTVPGVIYSNSDLVNVIFPKGGEAIAFQQGSQSSNAGLWEIVPSTSTDIFYNKGDVGIGKSVAPDASLEILDTAQAQLRLTHTEDTKFADFTLDTNHDLTITPSSTGQVIFQPTTDSTDFFQVLDADGGNPVLNVDSTNERVSIGTATADSLLHVFAASSGVAAPNANADDLVVEGSGNTGISVLTPAANRGAVMFGDPGNAGQGQFRYDHNLDVFQVVAGGRVKMSIESGGNVVIMDTPITALGKLHVDQESTTAAIPVLYLDQADVSEEIFQFQSTIGVGNAIEAVGAKTLTTTHFIKVTLPGALTRYIPVGTIA